MKKYWTKVVPYENVMRFLFIFIVSGFLCGILISQWLDSSILDSLSTMTFSTVLSDVDKVDFFITQFTTNVFICLLILFFGFSIIGMPFIAFVIFTKGVQIGFSCSIYIITYQLRGMLGILLTLIPQVFFDALAAFILGVVAFKMSHKLVKRCFFNQKAIDWKNDINENLNAVIISFSILLFSSIIKSTLVLYMMDWFQMFNN